MSDKIQMYWKSLPLRERWLLGVGFFALFTVILVFYIWQPMNQARYKLRANLPQLKANAQQMQLNALEVARIKSLPVVAPLPIGNVKEVLEHSAEKFNLMNERTFINVDSAGRISIEMENVSFDGWIKWLGNLQEQNRILVESCLIEGVAQPGLVKVKAKLLVKVAG
ncbi:type II secretion system protein GspM [Sulfurirhabdus autotrophica]|uniref:Type II secretion system protein M (GspM) n=1 Tax=Sulfurirhabdus autotrophica TaxID=1706046 RepID=A0A4R3XVV7_9PROT|nr:type II secretion system protein M [Sulfurirhabdus autotrophica]TCV83416.1 type II secretion system protein M (GspM) [Sulfurirhabdus autotrophica]